MDTPWEFRSYDAKGESWPAEDVIQAHDRLVIVPFKSRLLLYALPPIEDDEEE